MNRSRLPFVASLLLTIATCLVTAITLHAQQPRSSTRVVAPVDEAQVVTLRGNTHPLAQARFDQGRAPDDLPARRMLLLLSRTPEQQAAFDEFVKEQHTPGSANYRHWLAPAEV